MALTALRLDQMIFEQLGRGEIRLLALIVAVRKSLFASERVKGDLSAAVKVALRRMVAAKVVVDVEGVYSLSSMACSSPQ